MDTENFRDEADLFTLEHKFGGFTENFDNYWPPKCSCPVEKQLTDEILSSLTDRKMFNFFNSNQKKQNEEKSKNFFIDFFQILEPWKLIQVFL